MAATVRGYLAHLDAHPIFADGLHPFSAVVAEVSCREGRGGASADVVLEVVEVLDRGGEFGLNQGLWTEVDAGSLGVSFDKGRMRAVIRAKPGARWTPSRA